MKLNPPKKPPLRYLVVHGLGVIPGEPFPISTVPFCTTTCHICTL